MKASFKGQLIETPEFKTVGKNSTPLATLKLAENDYKKEGDKYVVSGKNYYEVKVWGDKALDAQFLEVGTLLDFSHYQNEGEDFIRFRAKIDERTWSWKGKDYSALQVTGFEWDVIEKEN